jgi:ABC-type polysaccharide/polyol phosphate transport system ATPase subunit
MSYPHDAVEVINVTKNFRKATVRQTTTLKTAFVNLIRGKRKRNKKETITVLDDISFAVKKGSTFGIMGRNGAGKSTLLKLIAGIMVPTKGKIAVNGTLTPLLELGSGFHPELTGRENILINGLILGITKKDIVKKYDDIIDFAELRSSIDQPIRTYSSGMYVRLAFSIAVNINPDIILLDEILAVGDAEFSKKSKAKIKEFKDNGKTIILVSHDPASILEMCDEALYLDNGKIQTIGEPAAVASAYKQIAG